MRFRTIAVKSGAEDAELEVGRGGVWVAISV